MVCVVVGCETVQKLILTLTLIYETLSLPYCTRYCQRALVHKFYCGGLESNPNRVERSNVLRSSRRKFLGNSILQ